MTFYEIMVAVIPAFMVAELVEVPRWAARRLVRWAARTRYPDPARAAIRAEATDDLIGEVPTGTLKLLVALTFAGEALRAAADRRVHARMAVVGDRARVRAHRAGVALTSAREQLTQLRHLQLVHKTMVGGLIRAWGITDGGISGAVLIVHMVVHTPSAESFVRFGTLVPFTADEWTEFHAATLAGLQSGCTCRRMCESIFLCDGKIQYIHDRINAFLRPRWSPEQRRLSKLAAHRHLAMAWAVPDSYSSRLFWATVTRVSGWMSRRNR
jgi:hypothetical protein